MVTLETITKRWIGLSSDTKPVLLEDDSQVPAGSSFLESDTGKVYRWNGQQWQYAAPSSTLELLMFDLLAEVTAMRTMIGLAVSK